MGQIDGRVVVRESGHAIPDVVVCAFCAKFDEDDFDRAQVPADLLEGLGGAIASALTEVDGRFTLSWVESETGERPPICIAIFAPEDVTDADRPLAAPSGEALLYLSRPMPASHRRTMLVRLLQVQVRKAEIQLCRPPTRACDELLDDMAARSRRAKEERDANDELKKRRQRTLAVRRRARTLVGELSGLPAHVRADRSDGTSPVIFGKARLAKQLPEAQAKVVDAGFKRMAEWQRSLSLRLTPVLVEQLGLKAADLDGQSGDGEQTLEKVEPKRVAALVREATAAGDLVRRRARPTAAQRDRLRTLVFAQGEEGDDGDQPT